MDIQNHFYGHSAVLAGYAGLQRPRHMAGLLQHGWTPVTPIRTHFADLADSAPQGNLFTWTHASRGWSEEESVRETGFASTPIGSPALYLAEMVRNSGVAIERSIDAVVFPFHGTRLLDVEGDHQGYAKEVFEREGSALVCMHVDDLQKPEIVEAWRQAGHSITTAGERRDPAFLARVMWLLMSSKKVVSNRLATALMYGAAVETPVSLYGPHFQIAGVQETSSEEYLRSLWPEFYEESISVPVLQKIAYAELGHEYMKSPSDLRSVLGWDSRGLRPFADYWIGAPWTKAKSILGLKQRKVGPVVNEAKLSPLHFLKDPFEHLPDRLPRSASTRLVAPDFINVG
ncbi:hypothetical protein [Arthrobacter sp. ISL-65]|uniref:hypothetical protein n=1 Tax=Arthrobacter sp. ISL-65 TaxID=2819112 RepID=UPI001BEA662D|nr:hypothetical protein [Arthrobacter sp. ISL-65]MBT2549814.1 hypothetical protein [Arthrobacter sp. ISL-65]